MGAVQPSPQTAKKAAEAQAETRSKGLVERFSAQMGGVQPEKMLSTLKATAFRLPAKYNSGNWTPQEVSNEQMMALLVVADKYGLNPFIKEIYAFPDKGGVVPIVGVDGWSRMINDHREFDGMKFEFSGESEILEHAKPCPASCTCIIYRKDRGHPTEVTEYLDEVYREPFIKNGEVKPGPWQSHTKRMLRHKAMIQAARIAFGFTGIHDRDEAERIVEASQTVIPAENSAASDLTDRFSPKRSDPDVSDAEIKDAPTEAREQPDEEGSSAAPPGPPKKTEQKNPKPDPTSFILEQIIASNSKEEVEEIVKDIAELGGLSQAKRMIIKKTAAAKISDFEDQ